MSEQSAGVAGAAGLPGSLTRLGRVFAIQCLVAMTFCMEAGEKWLGGKVPEWFTQQFGNTILAKGPGGLAPGFFSIAILETVIGVLALASIAKLEMKKPERPLLEWSLGLSLFLFVMLGFGMRLTGKHDAAAGLYWYFGATLVCIWFTNHDVQRTER